MPSWYGPFTFGEGIKRTFSIVNLGLVALVLAVTAAELRFDWVEKLAGNYLTSINAERPETGGIWESGRHALNAHQSLNKIIHQQQETLKTARRADSFETLAGELLPGEWVNLDKQQFKILYGNLPGRHKLIDPVRLVWLLNTGVVDRIFCEGRMGGLKIYFIDKDNRVVHQLDLDAKGENRDVIRSGLENMPGFSGRIYSASDFFAALFRLPKEMVSDLIQDTQLLLEQDGTLVRVGIGNTAQKGYIRLGFEFVRLGEPFVIQIRAREWAVWQLGLSLRGREG